MRSADRPLASEIVSKDVMILEIGREKVPTKAEKANLERSGEIISGVEIDGKWMPKKLHQEFNEIIGSLNERLVFTVNRNLRNFFSFLNAQESNSKGPSPSLLGKSTG